MKKKLFALIGKSGSGKNTVSDVLEERHGIKRIVSFTTRPPRIGEVNGKDYYFYNFETLIVLMARGKVMSLRSYTPHISQGIYPWYYGLNKDEIEKTENPLVILDPSGLEKAKEELEGYDIVSIYLDVPVNVLEKRLFSRDPEMLEEHKRRILSDEKDFENIENIVDHIVDGKRNKNTVAKEIKGIIENS